MPKAPTHSRSNKDPKTRVTRVRLTESQYQALKAAAKAEHITYSNYLRGLLDIAPSKIPPPQRKRLTRQADPALLVAVARIGNNLNQIGRWANTYKSTADALQILSGLSSIEAALDALIQSQRSCTSNS